ncbi:hypothetical protein Tco_1389607 [Tanacetum coccineum]
MHEEVQNTRGNMRTNSRASTLTCSRVHNLLQHLDFGMKSSNVERLWHPLWLAVGRRSSKELLQRLACCFIPRPRTYSTPTCIVSYANESWQVAAAVAAVRSARDEKVVLVSRD